MKKVTRKTFILGSLAVIILSRLILMLGTLIRLKGVRDKYSKCILFAGQQLSLNGKAYEGESLAVVYSGVIIDFRGATIKDTAILDLYGEYCGIKIIVPKKWRVSVDGQSKMSGVSNDIKYKKDNQKSPLLVIKHDLRYAGLEVTNKEDKKKDSEKGKKDTKKASKCC